MDAGKLVLELFAGFGVVCSFVALRLVVTTWRSDPARVNRRRARRVRSRR